MCLSEHGAPNPPVAHHVFTNNCCFDLFWRYVPFSLTHPHTHTPVIMILLRGATISYIITGVCVCVRVARTSHYILINWFGWYPRISDYIRCVSTWFKMHLFIFRTYVCIYIYTYTHPHRHQHLPMNSARNKPRRQQIPSTPAAAVATVVGLKFGV